jgi:CDP-diacylglycerol--glycerol-3-phosphate 3-phosphatidyltransferase
LLDWLDGFLARKYHMVTEFGGTMDLMADRIVENVFWVLLLYIGMVPIWIPIIFIAKGFIVDASRAHAKRPGWSVIHSKLSYIFVSSRVSRGISGVSKAAAFISSFGLYYLIVSISNGQLLQYQSMIPGLSELQIGFVWFTTIFHVVRGVLTISDSLKFTEM